MKFLPTFSRGKNGRGQILGIFSINLSEKVGIWPKKVGICPVLKSKVGTRIRVNHAGLRVFCPLSHFFLLFNMIKSIKNIYN